MSGDGVLARLERRLGRDLRPDGWSVSVQHADGTADAVKVTLAHPLVPGEWALVGSEQHIEATVRETIAHWREITLVHGAPVRPERARLLRELRTLADWPHGEETRDALRAVARVLAEDGLLTPEEARWLDEAVSTPAPR